MRSSLRVLSFLLSFAVVVTRTTSAQPAAGPLIHHVTRQPDTGVLTIARPGLSERLAVTVDGKPAAERAGATETRLDVALPVSALTARCTYCVVVVDPLLRVEDVLVPRPRTCGRRILEIGGR